MRASSPDKEMNTILSLKSQTFIGLQALLVPDSLLDANRHNFYPSSPMS